MKFYYPLQLERYVGDTPPEHHHSNQAESLDFPAAEGTPLYAITTGVVAVSRATDEFDSYSTGKCVSIKFNMPGFAKPLYATYMHMSRVDVSEGATVKIGQQVGLVGNTGNSYGAHLHLQILEGGPFRDSGGSVAYRTKFTGEVYREDGGTNMTLTEKLFKYLAVRYGEEVQPSSGVAVDTRYSPFTEYCTKNIADSYMGVLPDIQNVETAPGLGIMYGIALHEYGNTPVGWLYARIFRTYIFTGTYIKFSKNLNEEGRALLDPKTSAWSFGNLYTESALLTEVKTQGSQEGLNNFYNMIKYGATMSGYSSTMADIDKMRIIAGGAPTGNNSTTGAPQDGKFHENYYAAGIVDAAWI